MPNTSGLVNYSTSRDTIITRALRIIGAIGQGETPSSTAVTEAAEALNDLVKEWQTDGMPLWALSVFTVTYTESVSNYTVSNGPLKITQAWNRNSSSNTDSPVIIITRQEYQILGQKFSEGTPSQLWYDPPGNYSRTGTVQVYPAPDSNAQTYSKLMFSGQKPFEYFNAAADVPDFPSYWYNAVKWGLAEQLAYEYGVPMAGRAQLSKKAEAHKEKALSFGTEEGSFKVHPQPSWNWEDY